MQLVTPGGNHCCLMAIVYGRFKLNIDSFFKNKFNMYLCIFTATVTSLDKHDKQKKNCILNRPVQDERKPKMRHFIVIAAFNVVQKNIYHGMVNYLFFCLFYSSICQLYNCQKLGCCNGICNFSNIFSITKQFFVTIFNVKTSKLNGIKK